MQTVQRKGRVLDRGARARQLLAKWTTADEVLRDQITAELRQASPLLLAAVVHEAGRPMKWFGWCDARDEICHRLAIEAWE